MFATQKDFIFPAGFSGSLLPAHYSCHSGLTLFLNAFTLAPG